MYASLLLAGTALGLVVGQGVAQMAMAAPPLVEAPPAQLLMDQLYFPLVDSPAVRAARSHKAQLVETAAVPASSDPDAFLHALYAGAPATALLHLPADNYTGDLGDSVLFGGIVTFAGLPATHCFTGHKHIDVAILGAPFDTGVLYRPTARFGPNVVRQGGRRLGPGLRPDRGEPGLRLWDLDPYSANVSVVDCGDVPMTPFDNRVALNQLYRGMRAVHRQGLRPPRVIMLGGDHTTTLMALRLVAEHHGPVHVLHFDLHIDTWRPEYLGGKVTRYALLNHGTFLHYAHELGFLAATNWHLGVRAPYVAPGRSDERHDTACGFQRISARDMDRLGAREIAARVVALLPPGAPVYILVDIDVLDPAYAPGTGTMEVGGWTTRELLTVLESLSTLNVVGADVVEVAEGYDNRAGTTGLAAAAVVDALLGLVVGGLV